MIAGGLLLILFGLLSGSVFQASADIPPGAITPTPSGSPAATPYLCDSTVDISLVFDHSGSMSQTNKLQNAQQAAAGFVNQLAGGDGNLSPHQMALTGFSDGIAVTDVALTNSANPLTTTLTLHRRGLYQHRPRSSTWPGSDPRGTD